MFFFYNIVILEQITGHNGLKSCTQVRLTLTPKTLAHCLNSVIDECSTAGTSSVNFSFTLIDKWLLTIFVMFYELMHVMF